MGDNVIRNIGFVATWLIVCFGVAINNPAITLAACYANFMFLTLDWEKVE